MIAPETRARDALGFRQRGERTTRLEAFIDAAFAACFWLLATFWRGHVDWSERFGLDDAHGRRWSLMLVFLVLIFVYPLKIVFSVFFAWISGEALPAQFSFRDMDDVQLMFQMFAVAFGSMGAVLFVLNRQAWRQREALALDALEVDALRLVLRLWVLLPAFALLSIALSFWEASLRYGAPGMIFFVMHAVQTVLRARHRRRLTAALASSAA